MKNLVIFKAHWCKTCGPMVKVAQAANLGIPISTIDIDADPIATTEFNIRGVPTLILMEETQVVKRYTGSMSAEQLKEFVR
jgi:thioredoxin 1